jgi:2-oxo-3-hexenedioate decarboxylase
MITPADIAKQLIAAERERVAIARFTDADPELDIATAYLAQRAFVQGTPANRSSAPNSGSPAR